MNLRLVLLICIFTLSSGASIFLIIDESPQVIFKKANDNLDELIAEQYLDMISFEEELSVYSNPFSITNNGSLTKRVFLNGGLIYWNDDAFTPSYSALKQSDTLYTLQDELGLKLVQRRQVLADRDLIEIFSIITLATKPQISNQYLSASLNENVFGDYKVNLKARGKFKLGYKNHQLVSLEIEQQSTAQSEFLSLVFLIIALSMLFLIVWDVSKTKLSRTSYFISLISFVLVSRVLLRVYCVSLIDSWGVFDPINFTMGIIAPSLGELFLNGLTFLALAIITFYWVYSGRLDFSQYSLWQKAILLLILLGIQALIAILVYQSIWVLLDNSQFELDISESVIFDQYRIFAYAFMTLLGISVLIIFTTTELIYKKLRVNFILTFILSLSALVLAWFLTSLALASCFLVFVLLFFSVDILGINNSISQIKYQLFVYVVLIFAGISFVSAYSIYKHSEKDDLIAKEKFANRLLISNDILGEYYLSKIRKDISEDIYVRTRLLSKVLARQNIREKIQRQFLSSYFKKYDIDVFLFDEKGQSLSTNPNPKSWKDWNDQYAQPEFGTNYDGIYFIKDKDENVRNKYVCFIEISAYGRNAGYILLDLTLKKYIPKSVFPELLLESKYYLGSKQEFDYAIYQNGELKYTQGRHSFENSLSEDELDSERLFIEGLEKDEFHYYGLKTSDNRMIVISSSTYGLQGILANMSFLFLLLVFLSGFSFLVSRSFQEGQYLNLSTKIQVYLGLSFLIPMAIVSVALINTLNSSYKGEIDRSFTKRSYNVAENLLEQTESFFNNSSNIDEYANEIFKAASLVQSDLNIYDAEGKLMTTSQPEIFKLGLLSRLLDPEAFYDIKYKMSQSIISDKQIGTLDFRISYTALRSYKDGQLLGILSMPYFDSKNHLRRQQVEVFNNLIVIFSAIFMISLFGGNLIVAELVKPLKKIGARIRTMSLQDTNEPIYYEAQDEIGSLVNEYNAMLIKLEESKEALAKSQKESAWKEIARQVAHEIKNPLTPMRLKIQQMMRSLEPDTKMYETCELLINQVDSLSSIADSFSEFAKMPAPNNEAVNVIEMLDRTINLYQTSAVKLTKSYQVKKATVFIDPKIFSRILTNLLLNAIQACEGKEQRIDILVKRQGNKLLISIADSGVGIPANKREKIFTPYFSTKAEGSGIGLAIAKKGIENAGGNIWFESEEGKGTTFFISLPVHEA